MPLAPLVLARGQRRYQKGKQTKRASPVDAEEA
jgi:hypothetical protein